MEKYTERFARPGRAWGFLCVFEYDPHWCNVKVYEEVALEPFGNQRAHSHKSPDPVDTILEAETYLDGFYKADGCSEINLECHHRCRLEQWVDMTELVKWLWNKAHYLMSNSDEPEWTS